MAPRSWKNGDTPVLPLHSTLTPNDTQDLVDTIQDIFANDTKVSDAGVVLLNAPHLLPAAKSIILPGEDFEFEGTGQKTEIIELDDAPRGFLAIGPRHARIKDPHPEFLVPAIELIAPEEMEKTFDSMICLKKGEASFPYFNIDLTEYQCRPEGSFELTCGDPMSKLSYIAGISTPFGYYSPGKSHFGGHLEDWTLASYNIVFAGAMKLWVAVKPSSTKLLEDKLHEFFPDAGRCSQFMRHLGISVAPGLLRHWGVEHHFVPQMPGQIVAVSGSTYHWGINTGHNYAEAINFCMEKNWISPSGYKKCYPGCGIGASVPMLEFELEEGTWEEKKDRAEVRGAEYQKIWHAERLEYEKKKAREDREARDARASSSAMEFEAAAAQMQIALSQEGERPRPAEVPISPSHANSSAPKRQRYTWTSSTQPKSRPGSISQQPVRLQHSRSPTTSNSNGRTASQDAYMLPPHPYQRASQRPEPYVEITRPQTPRSSFAFQPSIVDNIQVPGPQMQVREPSSTPQGPPNTHAGLARPDLVTILNQLTRNFGELATSLIQESRRLEEDSQRRHEEAQQSQLNLVALVRTLVEQNMRRSGLVSQSPADVFAASVVERSATEESLVEEPQVQEQQVEESHSEHPQAEPTRLAAMGIEHILNGSGKSKQAIETTATPAGSRKVGKTGISPMEQMQEMYAGHAARRHADMDTAMVLAGLHGVGNVSTSRSDVNMVNSSVVPQNGYATMARSRMYDRRPVSPVPAQVLVEGPNERLHMLDDSLHNDNARGVEYGLAPSRPSPPLSREGFRAFEDGIQANGSALPEPQSLRSDPFKLLIDGPESNETLSEEERREDSDGDSQPPNSIMPPYESSSSHLNGAERHDGSDHDSRRGSILAEHLLFSSKDSTASENGGQLEHSGVVDRDSEPPAILQHLARTSEVPRRSSHDGFHSHNDRTALHDVSHPRENNTTLASTRLSPPLDGSKIIGGTAPAQSIEKQDANSISSSENETQPGSLVSPVTSLSSGPGKASPEHAIERDERLESNSRSQSFHSTLQETNNRDGVTPGSMYTTETEGERGASEVKTRHQLRGKVPLKPPQTPPVSKGEVDSVNIIDRMSEELGSVIASSEGADSDFRSKSRSRTYGKKQTGGRPKKQKAGGPSTQTVKRKASEMEAARDTMLVTLSVPAKRSKLRSDLLASIPKNMDGQAATEQETAFRSNEEDVRANAQGSNDDAKRQTPKHSRAKPSRELVALNDYMEGGEKWHNEGKRKTRAARGDYVQKPYHGSDPDSRDA